MKNIKIIVILIIIVKLILLFFGAHAFDFWSFVNGIQKWSIYDLPLFEHWNKGNIYHILVLPFFGLYSVILNVFHLQYDNMLLLHFFMKLPFFFIDIFCGYFIYEIIKELTGNKKYGYYGFILWFINPFIYFVYGIHGHYELLTLFGLLLFIFGLTKKNIFYTIIGFSIAFIIKYWIIIFAPFLLLYFIYNKNTKKNILYGIIIFGLFLIISYIHLFLDKTLFYQTFDSIIHLSKVNVPDFVSLMKIPDRNIFSSIYFLFTGNPITNKDNLLLFNIASKGLLFSGISILLYFIYRLKNILSVKKYYIKILLQDFFIILIMFFIFSSNFQLHYFIYFIAFLIIFIFIRNFKLLYILISLIVLLLLKGLQGELGPRTYFLDINHNLSINFLLPSIHLHYLEGSLIILLLISIIFYLFHKGENKIRLKDLKFYYYFNIVLFLILGVVFINVIQKTDFNKLPNILAYASGGNKSRGYTEALYKTKEVLGNKILFSDFSKTPILNYITDNNNNLFNYYILAEDNLNIDKFNNCKDIKKDKKLIKYGNKNYISYIIPKNCIKSTNNELILNKNINNNIYLYIRTISQNINYINNKKLEIYILAIIGFLYILGFSYISYKSIIYTLKNSQTDN